MTELEQIRAEAAQLLGVELREGETLTSNSGRWRIINEQGKLLKLECKSCETMKTVTAFYTKGAGRRRSHCIECETQLRKDRKALRKLKERKGIN